MKRRTFIKNATLSGAGITVAGAAVVGCEQKSKASTPTPISTLNSPIAICTWGFTEAIAKAGEVLTNSGAALDAVEEGVKVEEADEKNQSVGLGGRPDRDGNVTLDACIMDKEGNCGSVVYLKNIKHPISVARMVMEDTPHVMLAGDGAKQFALQSGFKEENLLTETSKKELAEWQKTSDYKPVINIENHDTIGMLAIDQQGDIAGACTTSGLAYKMNGRVGDSPIIGSGLYVDNEVGGATATGMGQEIVKVVGSFLIVELMRQGKSPQEACEEAVKRIVQKRKNYKDFQAAFVAIDKNGRVGTYAIHSGFRYSLFKDGQVFDEEADFHIKSQ